MPPSFSSRLFNSFEELKTRPQVYLRKELAAASILLMLFFPEVLFNECYS
jgi:hypothetical protein